MAGVNQTTETRHLTLHEQHVLHAAQRRSLRLLCDGCGKFTVIRHRTCAQAVRLIRSIRDE